jgi:hypothetical protein
MRDRCQAVEGRATEGDTRAILAMPALRIIWRTLVTPGTAPKGATIQTVASPTRGPPIWAEAPTEAEGMPEAEDTVESEAAATTWEASLTGGGGGLGAAGNEAS